MAETISITLDGKPLRVPAGCSVAVAVMTAGDGATRTSVTGQPRGPVCGMGICFECRVTIDGVAHRRGCMEAVRAGMEITTRE